MAGALAGDATDCAAGAVTTAGSATAVVSTGLVAACSVIDSVPMRLVIRYRPTKCLFIVRSLNPPTLEDIANAAAWLRDVPQAALPARGCPPLGRYRLGVLAGPSRPTASKAACPGRG